MKYFHTFLVDRIPLGIIILLGLAILVASNVPSNADETGYRPANEWGEGFFSVDAVDFQSEQEKSIDILVSYKIFYNGLTYQKGPDGYTAQYEMAIVIEGDKDNQIEGIIKEGEIRVKTYLETIKATDFAINMFRATCENQDYQIRAILTDKLANTTRQLEIKRDKRKYVNKYPTISKVEFAREISDAGGASKFNRGGWRVIPNVTRLYGGNIDSVLKVYFEVYPGQNEIQSPTVIVSLYHHSRGLRYADTVSYDDMFETKIETRKIDVADYMPGDYEMEITVIGRRGRLFNKRVELFELNLTAESIFKNDYELAIKMLKYLSSRNEAKKFKAAKTDEQRRALWDEFWSLRDDERQSAQNPTKKEYFRRVRHANRYFSGMKKDGWKTSRGMIYITYGVPDEVDDHPFELNGRPYQFWIYYNAYPPRRFLFIDEWGDSNYILQPPFNGIN